MQSEGGDNCMLTKSVTKSAQDLTNKREILLANQGATNLGGVMRSRVFQNLSDHIDPPQYADGFGFWGCEL